MRTVFTFFLSVCLANNLLADDLLLSEPSFSPSRFFIGDKVQMRVSFSTPSNSKLSAPNNLPAFDRAKILSVSVYERGDNYELLIDFIPYYSGTLQFPPINLGSVSIEGLSAYVVNSLPNDELVDFSLDRQENSPFIIWLFVIQGLLWLGAPILAFLGIRFLVTLFQKNRRLALLKLPLKDFESTMQNVLQGTTETVVHYRELTNSFKKFIELRFGVRARGATNSELLNLLEPLLTHYPDLATEISHILSTSDQVKFAGVSIDQNTSHAHILRLTEAARMLEDIFVQNKGDDKDAI